jgi:hypothetical protein
MSGLVLGAATAGLAAVAGYGAGLLHFRLLRLVADRIVAGRGGAAGLQIGRFAAMGLFLALCALVGAPALLGAVVGVTFGRAKAVRGAR